MRARQAAVEVASSGMTTASRTTLRDLIVARVEMGLSYEEIAEELGKPTGNAARMAIARALLRLAAELKHHS